MLKISKLTDYGLLAMVYLARKSGETVAAREIARFYTLPLPVVTKVLKTLHHGGLIRSYRGADGGYSFEGDAEQLSLGTLLATLEGPWDLVECESLDGEGHAVCSIRACCPSRRLLFGINRAVKSAFDSVTLGDISRGEVPTPTVDVKPAVGRELQ